MPRVTSGSTGSGSVSTSVVTTPPFVSTRYYTSPGALSAVIPAEGSLTYAPIMIPASSNLDRIGAEVTVVGTAGAVVRLGIYSDDGTGRPGALVLDAGTIDGTSATAQTITISQALATGGIYWLAAVVQGAAGTRPTMRLVQPAPPFGLSSATTPGATTQNVYSQTGVAGALPGPAVPSASFASTGVRVFARAT